MEGCAGQILPLLFAEARRIEVGYIMPGRLAVLVPTLWLGILVGVTFIATPVKFRAPSLTRPVALDVGRVTFRFFSRIEWCFAALLLGIDAVTKGATWRLSMAGLIAAIVALQSAWLLPALDRRVAVIVAGGTLPPSRTHRIYGALEGAKLLGLLALVATGIAN
jgi:hypothetical protein